MELFEQYKDQNSLHLLEVIKINASLGVECMDNGKADEAEKYFNRCKDVWDQAPDYLKNYYLAKSEISALNRIWGIQFG